MGRREMKYMSDRVLTKPRPNGSEMIMKHITEQNILESKKPPGLRLKEVTKF